MMVLPEVNPKVKLTIEPFGIIHGSSVSQKLDSTSFGSKCSESSSPKLNVNKNYFTHFNMSNIMHLHLYICIPEAKAGIKQISVINLNILDYSFGNYK